MRKKVIPMDKVSSTEAIYHSFQNKRFLLSEHSQKLRRQISALQSLMPEENVQLIENIKQQILYYQQLLPNYPPYQQVHQKLLQEINKLNGFKEQLENSLTAQAPARIFQLQQRLARLDAQIEYLDLTMSELEVRSIRKRASA